MNEVAFYRRLFSYDAWANREVISNCRAAASPPAPAVRLIAHILSAQRLWLERLENKKQSLPVWPSFSLADCEREAPELSNSWNIYLSALNHAGLQKSVEYVNSKGETWSNSVSDILLHVAMHSTYHRGQVAALVRAAGLSPAYTDFIHSVRQGLSE
jgi:uncharacterized damage-inducible protein DinB